MDDYYRPRSRSQSRQPHPQQPPPQDDHQFVPLDRSHRSKSLDNRREFQQQHEGDDPFYDPPAAGGFRDTFHASIPKRNYERRFGGGDDHREGDGFFNESITIPRSTVKVSPSRMDADKNEHNWTSYDKTIKYGHNRTNYPPPPPPQYPPYYRYEEYGSGGDRLIAPPPPAEISPRSYPESDYYQRAQVQRPYYDARSADAASGYRTEQRIYEEERERAERAERERAERVVREQREVEERTRHEGTQAVLKNGKNGHGASGGGYAYQASGYQRGGYGASRGGRRGGKPEREYHRVTCCCFRFYWPPWGYEPCEPVQPWYPNPSPSRPPSPSPPPIQKQPR